MTHVLLGIFFGGVCAHNFYSGRWALALTKGLIQFAALLWWLNELYRAVPEDAAWTGFLGFWLFVWVVGLVQVWNLLEVCLVRHDAAGKPFQVA